MTALLTYAETLAAVEAVLAPRRVEARKWARPELWAALEVRCVESDGYSVSGTPVWSNDHAFVGGITPAPCKGCGTVWEAGPCQHQLGLAALWVGGHPFAESALRFDRALAARIERGPRFVLTAPGTADTLAALRSVHAEAARAARTQEPRA